MGRWAALTQVSSVVFRSIVYDVRIQQNQIHPEGAYPVVHEIVLPHHGDNEHQPQGDQGDHVYSSPPAVSSSNNGQISKKGGGRYTKAARRKDLPPDEVARRDAEANRRSMDRAKQALWRSTEAVNAKGLQCVSLVYNPNSNQYYVGGDNSLVTKVIAGDKLIPSDAVLTAKVIDTHALIKKAHQVVPPSPEKGLNNQTSPVIPLTQDLTPEKALPVPTRPVQKKRKILQN